MASHKRRLWALQRRFDNLLCLQLGQPKGGSLARDDRVSLTIDHDMPQVIEITGLSMAAHARPVVEPAEASKALHMLRLRYPELPVPMPEGERDSLG